MSNEDFLRANGNKKGNVLRIRKRHFDIFGGHIIRKEDVLKSRRVAEGQ